MASSAFSFHCMICFEEFDPQTNYPVVLPCGHTYVCIECANRLDKCMECRMPLTMKMEAPPPPPPPPHSSSASSSSNSPNHHLGSMSTATAAAAAAASPSSSAMNPDIQKENQKNQYAERVKNSPGWRRRYGTDAPGGGGGGSSNNNNGSGSYYGSKRSSFQYQQQQQQPPQPPPPKIRLPLPKNAVLLSLIQASEPARRRAEVEAPSTPQKSMEEQLTSPPNFVAGRGGRWRERDWERQTPRSRK